MCVWCAYTGKAPAAPKLWENLRKIEGLWGGFYTGMVTLDHNRFQMQKCVGSTDVWKKHYAMAEFSGTTGLIHSRTNSGGDEHRTHPFIGMHGLVALVSQGSMGIYAEQSSRFIDRANAMQARGRICSSAVADGSRGLQLADGTTVHLSDVVCNAVEEEYEKTHDPLAAMRAVAAELHEESATIFLFRDRPGYIGFVNVNQHLVYDAEADGVYLSVTALGVPGLAAEIPANSVGYVTADGTVYREHLSDSYEPVDTVIPPGTVPAFALALIQQPGLLLGQVCDTAVGPLFPHRTLEYRAVAAYRALEALHASGRIRWEESAMPGSTGVPGRIFKLFWQE